MVNGTDDAELQAFLLAGNTRQEGTFRVVGERSAQGITHVIGKCGNAIELPDVCLHRKFLQRIGTLAGTPALSIYKYGGVDLVHFIPDDVHRLNVVNAHEVETEAVDVVFIDPVFHRFNHEPPHHRTVRGGLVATPRAVGILSFVGLAIVIVGIGLLEITIIDVVGVVVNHVKNHANAGIVEGLHHLLELPDPACRVGRVGGV